MWSNLTRTLHIVLILTALCLIYPNAVAQQPTAQPTPPRADDVLTIKSELVQTPVMVFDKKGHFVEGLQRDQFELKIDGQPRAISFLDQLSAGSAKESLRVNSSPAVARPGTQPPSFGRTIIFFLDDLHLSQDSINRARAALRNFIDSSLGQDDRVLLATASGQLGFLQQLTDNQAVLDLALERLHYRNFFVPDETRPPMSPYQAIAIEANDSNVIHYFEEVAYEDRFQNMVHQMPSLPGSKDASATRQMSLETAHKQAEQYVRTRAHNLLTQYSTISAATLRSLEELMRSSVAIPGSKLIILVSDGFLMNRKIAGELQGLQEVAAVAMRAGAVIYSIQASGLSSAFPTAQAVVRLGPDEEPGVGGLGEDTATQAPLYTVAVDTGGRAFFNSNSIESGIRQAVSETSEYYLVAWRPETSEQRSNSFRQIQITVKDHPDWTIRVRRGYTTSSSPSTAASASPSDKGAAKATNVDDTMREALSQLYPIRDLPCFLNVSFLDATADGAELIVNSEVSIGKRTTPGGIQSSIELRVVVLDDGGRTVASYHGALKPDTSISGAPGKLSQTTPVRVKPGIYQVRMAAHDAVNQITGTAAQWIAVPDLRAHPFALSSIVVGEVKDDGSATANAAYTQKAMVNASNSFAHDSRMRLSAYIYNAARNPTTKTGAISVQLRLRRNNQEIFASPSTPVSNEPDELGRIPYAGELNLRTLPAGRYQLQVTATDSATQARAIQTVKFTVE